MEKVLIHPSAVIDSDAELGSGVKVGPNCVVGGGVVIGEGTELHANVVIGEGVQIGKDNRFFSNCVIGGQPQILGTDSETKFGGLTIGDGNTVREQVTIHPSMHVEESTVIGSNNLLMIGVHIGHDCVLEDNIVMSNYSQLSGHCKVGMGVWFSGMVVVHQFVTIGKWSYAAGMAGINRDIPPFMIISGHYPPRVRGVNKRGMVRAGLSEEQQKQVIDVHRKLYRSNGKPLLENAMAMLNGSEVDENIEAIVDAIIKSGEHRFGRYLEQFRH